MSFSKILLLFLFSAIASADSDLSIILNKKSDSFEFKTGLQKDFIAHADFKNAINETGFSFLEVQTNGNFTDILQAYAAGFVEGVVSRELIETHFSNILGGYCTKPLSEYCQKLQQFLDENFKWMNDQISLHAKTDSFWHQVQLTLLQQQGLIDAYNLQSRHPSSIQSLVVKPDVTGPLLLLFVGELGDLESVIGVQSGGKVKPIIKFQHKPSCSALIKLTPGNKDLLISHNTWNTYSSMLRTLKKYTLPFLTTQRSGGKVVPGKIVSFSSYPGLLCSLDDFYMVSTGLAVQETTLENYNRDLWKLVKPSVVPEAIRAIVANRLAKTGREWVKVFVRHNSGTYNNQWMVLDYNKFTPDSPTLTNGLLHVAEQLPDVIVAADVTNVLRKQSYWPSYNSPYFEEIYNKSNTQSMVLKYGDWFTYDKTPRALIFKRDHAKVVDLDSMASLMRYNDYTHDPLSACECLPPYSAENAIACRSDLNPPNGTYPFESLGNRNHGAIDFKITSWDLSQKLQFLAVSGPTNVQVPTFQWSTSVFKDSAKHLGHPDVWDFEPFVHKWKYL